MATSSNNTDTITFQQRIQQIRLEIDKQFYQVHTQLEERREYLIALLEEIAEEFESQISNQKKAISSLEVLKSNIELSLKENIVNIFYSKQLNDINDEIAILQLEIREPRVIWEWEESRVNELIQGMGVIHKRGECLNESTDSSNKKIPNNNSRENRPSFGHREMNISGGLAIDKKTDNIYAIEFDCDRLLVFSPKRDFLFSFGDESYTQSGPQGVAIHDDRVYVTRWRAHSLQMYTLDGKFIISVGKRGSDKGEFKHPYGITVDEDSEEIYVCDLRNNRVQIFSTNLKFKSIFQYAKFDRPLDVKVRKNLVFILDHSNPCMHILSKDGELINSIISRGAGQQTEDPWYFDVDLTNNILLTDFTKHCVLVFKTNGEVIHHIARDSTDEFTEPSGIVITSGGGIIVACRKNVGCLQEF